MFKKKDKNRVKVEFTITLICLKEFPKAEIGSECYVELKRGKKIENCPISKILATKESTVQFDEKFKINCSFHQNSTTNKFDKKELLITAKRNTSKKKEKKWSTLGKNVIDLSNYAEAGTIRHEILTLINKDDKKDKKTRPVTVTLKIETNWLKVNDQKLTKVPTPAPEKKEDKKEDKKEEKPLTKENLDKQTVSLGGNTFVVEQDEVTESVASFSDGEEKINFSDSESEEEPVKPVRKATIEEKPQKEPPPKKEVPPPRDEFSDDEDPFDETPANNSAAVPEAIAAELEDLKSDKLRLERKVEKLSKDLEEKKKEIETLKTKSTPTTSVDKPATGPDPKVTELRTKLEAETKEKAALAAEIAVMKQKLKETETRKERAPTKKGTRANEVEMELEDARESENKARIDLEKIQKKYKNLQRDLEERKIIESAIYLAETQYNETSEMPVATKILIEKLFAVSAFEPMNESFLGSVLVSIRKTFSRSSHDTDSLCFWFSYSVSLFKQLKEEVGEQMMSFDDKVILTCPVDVESVDSMKPGPKFFYQLGGVIFDAYEKLLSAVYHPMDHLLTSYILEQNENLFDTTQLRNRRKYNNDFPILLLDVMKLLKSHYISDRVAQAVLDQIFYYIDCQIFNIFLRQPQLFTASRGFKIKMAISQIESSLSKHSAAFANKQFNYIKEAANLLVMDKSLMSDTSLIQQIFSHLNYLQVKHIVERFKPDELSPERTPENVKQALRDLCLKKENSKLSLDLEPSQIKPINLLL